MEYNIYEVDYRFLSNPSVAIVSAKSDADASSLLMLSLDEGGSNSRKNIAEIHPTPTEIIKIEDTGFKTNRSGIISPNDLEEKARSRIQLLSSLLKHGSPTAAAYEWCGRGDD